MSRETHKRVEVAIRVVRSKDDKVPDGFAAMHEDGPRSEWKWSESTTSNNRETRSAKF